MAPAASPLVFIGFVVLPLLVAAMFVGGVEWAGRRRGDDEGTRQRRVLPVAVGTVVWLALTGLLAASGVLRRFDVLPPPFGILVLSIVALGFAIAYSPLGTLLVRGLPLWALVGSQVFRFPLELVMHQAAVEGVMPGQMSYTGRNFDILTGISAGVLGWWLRRGGVSAGVVTLWNVLGLALLVNVVTIALLSTPLVRWYGTDPKRVLTFVTYPPYVWLPAILVLAALVGHLLIFRKLAARDAAATPFR
jgi:hypothetical protein